MASVGMCPVRCYTCGKVIAPLRTRYEKLLRGGAAPGEALLGVGLAVTRECCRMHVMGASVDSVQVIEPISTAGHIEFLSVVPRVNSVSTR